MGLKSFVVLRFKEFDTKKNVRKYLFKSSFGCFFCFEMVLLDSNGIRLLLVGQETQQGTSVGVSYA